MVSGTVSEPVEGEARCFFRGKDIDWGSDYKCYIETHEEGSKWSRFIYALFHRDDTCGGDGIFLK